MRDEIISLMPHAYNKTSRKPVLVKLGFWKKVNFENNLKIGHGSV